MLRNIKYHATYIKYVMKNLNARKSSGSLSPPCTISYDHIKGQFHYYQIHIWQIKSLVYENIEWRIDNTKQAPDQTPTFANYTYNHIPLLLSLSMKHIYILNFKFECFFGFLGFFLR